MNNSRKGSSRRGFLKGSLSAVAVLAASQTTRADEKEPAAHGAIVKSSAVSPSEKLNLAFVGVNGKGADALNQFSTLNCNYVALADCDFINLGRAAAQHPGARCYTDWRKMLEQKDIDAVVVSIPDHNHAVVAMASMQLGKHVYCEKPLTHDVFETRTLMAAAKKYNVATQMGNQGHASDGSRRQVEWMQSGALGAIKEVHVWTDRPLWPSGINRPKETPPVPENINWDVWLGPAPERPYNPAYLPQNWRGWWDFGTGALGDMACHIMDTAYWALDLRDPIKIESQGEGKTSESPPTWSIIKYTFAATAKRPGLTMTWYDGKKKPPAALTGGKESPEGNGVLIVGEKATMFAPYTQMPTILDPEQHADFKPPAPSLPNSVGHFKEFVIAAKGGPPAGANFDYAGPLTELVLLGNLAVRTGQTIEWDSATMKCKGLPEADAFVHREYRKGWTLGT